MGKQTKIREAQKRAEEQALRNRLRTHARSEAQRGFIGSFAEFAPAYRARIELYRRFAIRAPEVWTSRVRARSPELRFLDLVTFTFAQFPAPAHLEQAWTAERVATANCGQQGPAPFELGQPDPCYWYILAAQGKSLFREATHPYISKRETHYFLNAPPNVASTTRAFWYAAAMAANEDVETAERVSRTKVATFPITCKFWKDVARFFARNPAPVLEMNALIDYLQVAKDMDATYDVHGRSLPSLRRQMAGWHRKLRETNTLDTDKWQGQPIPDAIYRTDGENGAATWRLHQITNGKELVSEGMRMQHCVVAYKSQCMQGLSSIWSLTCEYPAGKFNRGITVEVSGEDAITQCRGFANRRPTESELAILGQWASDYGLSIAV